VGKSAPPSAWRSRWHATIASDVSKRDGIGWEFTDPHGREVWAVFREDGDDFPVFSAIRGDGELPPLDELEEMTLEAVADLLAARRLRDPVGWITTNISAALLLASCEITGWEGPEWAIESGEDDIALEWAEPTSGRTPFAWLRAKATDREVVIDIYQDNVYFGLDFLPTFNPQLANFDTGSLRARLDAPVLTGRINKVEVVFDTELDEKWLRGPGVVSEVLLHGDTSSSLLIAAEAYSRDEWHLYDESVVVLPDVTVADALPWIPARHKWRPTQSPGR
jgi:hypothetical protein